MIKIQSAILLLNISIVIKTVWSECIEQGEICFSEAAWQFSMLNANKLRFDFTNNFYGVLPESLDLLERGIGFYGEYYGQFHPNLDIKFLIDPNDNTLTCQYRVFLNPTSAGIREWKSEFTIDRCNGNFHEYQWDPSGREACLKDDILTRYIQACDRFPGYGQPSREKCVQHFQGKKMLEKMELNSSNALSLTNEATLLAYPSGLFNDSIWEHHYGPRNAFFKNMADEGDYIDMYMEGGGTFNEEVDDPKCLYDFYRVVTARSEYDLLRYCAKGYFYRGFDCNDPRARLMRKDWVLYMIQGKLICSVNDVVDPKAVEHNRELLDKGYTVEMVLESPPNEKGQTWNEIKWDCPDKFVLSQYKDHNKEGEFVLAGILGSSKFDNNECYKNNPLWNLRRQDGKYQFKLRVGHYCTKTKEHEELVFDLSFHPDELHDEGIQEDLNMEILLDSGIMRFSSNYLLCNEQLKINETKECDERKEKIRQLFNIRDPSSKSNDQIGSILGGSLKAHAKNIFKSVNAANATTTFNMASANTEDLLAELLRRGIFNGKSENATAGAKKKPVLSVKMIIGGD